MTTILNKLKSSNFKYIKIAVALIIILFIGRILYIIYEVYSIKDIDMANVYIKHSDNNRYKVRTIFPFRHNIGGSPTYIIVSETATDKILDIGTMPPVDIEPNDHWRYSTYNPYINKTRDDYILGYGNLVKDAMDIDDQEWEMWVNLPPSIFQRFKTWLAVDVRGFEYPKSVEEYLEEKVNFIKGGGDVNAQDRYGRTVLMYSAHYDNITVSKFLIDNGADVKILDNDNKSALYFASIHRRLDIMHLLHVADNSMTFDLAITFNDLERVKQFIKGKDKYDVGYALIEASEGGFIDIAKFLIEAGADVNTIGYNDDTALLSATSLRRTNIIELLIDAGADINAQDDSDTVLSNAASRGYTDIVEILIKLGVNLNTQHGYDNNTSLMEASMRGYTKTVEQLLKGGADFTISNKEGKTALQYAIGGGHEEIVTLLKLAGAKE